MASGNNNGSTNTVQQTAHWTAVIATVAVSLGMLIGMVAMAAVAWRDGNTELVSNAMAGMIQIATTSLATLAIVAGAPQVVSAIMQRIQNAMIANGQQTPPPAQVPAQTPSAPAA